MTIPEITIGMTKMVRIATFARILPVSPTASRKDTMLTTTTVTSEKPTVNR